ncbi:MAG: Spy/CpxP family protein refolding chaperone [Syntrophorhabdales bacterium]|jgi:Spy/CpxP family protein refolding chaperone
MKRLYPVCLAISLLFLAAPLFAQENDVINEEMIVPVADMSSQNPPQPPMAAHHPHEGFHPGFYQGHEGFLNLSEDQKMKTRNLWLQHLADTHGLRYELMQKRVEMERLFTDPKADAGALLAKERELSAVRQQLEDRRAQAMIQWRSLLTPEQIQKLDVMMSAHRMAGGMGSDGMGGPMGHEMMEHHMGCPCGMGGMHHEMGEKGPGMHHEMGAGK